MGFFQRLNKAFNKFLSTRHNKFTRAFKILTQTDRAENTYLDNQYKKYKKIFRRNYQNRQKREKQLFNEKIDYIRNQREEQDRNKRINEIFTKKLNLANTTESLGKNSKEKSKVFYMATQHLWEKAPSERRNEMIIKKLNEKYGDINNLEEAYNFIMKEKENKEAVKILADIYKGSNKISTKNRISTKKSKEEEIVLSPPELYGIGLKYQ